MRGLGSARGRSRKRSDSGVRQKLGDLGLVRLVNDLGAGEVALALARLVREQVALVRLLVLELAARGLLEALLRGRMRLELGHLRSPNYSCANAAQRGNRTVPDRRARA